MRIGRGEAIDIFRKWLAEGLTVRWQGTLFTAVAFSSSAKIVSVSDQELRLATDDFGSELVVRLDGVVGFGYGDSRIAPEDGKKYDECVVLFFDPVLEQNDPARILLAALNPEFGAD